MEKGQDLLSGIELLLMAQQYPGEDPTICTYDELDSRLDCWKDDVIQVAIKYAKAHNQAEKKLL